ncbi:unnamed protein product, partial [Mesorhabditis belari]|uniref:Nucleoside phosphorylase domain-containing protein n=1 Tax=Mesorhabditis belari TaxID=2138241 RepID=A0AAF3E975_9BILA
MSVFLHNNHLNAAEDDFLYHFGFGKYTKDLAQFADVKFVCTGGSAHRFELYAKLFSKETALPCSENLALSDRYVVYKTGPVLWINHGIGAPSLSIMLNETLKMLAYAGAKDVSFIRLGTSGGVGVAPGTVVISDGAINGELKQKYVQWIAGERVERETHLDEGMRAELAQSAAHLDIPHAQGKTLCADDFYEGQMRLDGFFCNYESEDKFDFLRKLQSLGVRNIEMESTCFSATLLRAGVKGAICCVTLLNRMDGDQVKLDKDTYLEFEMRPFRVVTAYIRKQIDA